MHLALGDNYVRTVLGNKETGSATDEKAITPAKVQLMFTLAASEPARRWTVRELAQASGLSKSNVAKLRQQLVNQGILQKTETSS
jgi:DNA-binding MarR family transcriptional regulator